MSNRSLFRSFFQGGFECSSHRRRDGKRLDLIAATGHDRFVRKDYLALRGVGIRTVRDGVRWHLIETHPYRYDSSSVRPMLQAARESGTQVIWDLCHYGWPDDVDVFSSAFIKRFARLAGAFARMFREESDDTAFITPLNEPSFLAWAGGDVNYLNPFAKGRGHELKCQLARAIIAATEAIWDEMPDARICQCEPAIHITADPNKPQDRDAAENYRLFQFQALDMLAGVQFPELGGNRKYLDIIGLNYYSNNQWIHQGRTLERSGAPYRPFHQLAAEFYSRYQCPLFIAETGIEGELRACWLRYVAREVVKAMEQGVPVEGLCLYPILNHPGWDDERHCHCGLFDYADKDGNRSCYEPLARELRSCQEMMQCVGELELV